MAAAGQRLAYEIDLSSKHAKEFDAGPLTIHP
jgi:hypothetical protein